MAGNNLTPQLTQAQLKQNIDALQKGGTKTADIQSYVDNYQSDGKGGYVLKTGAQPSQPAAPAAPGIVDQTNEHAANIAEDLSQKPNFTGAADVAGNVAGEANDILGDGMKSVWNLLPDGAKTALVGNLPNAMKSVAGSPAAKSLLDAWNGFEAQHPDAAKNIGNFINIGALLGGDAISPTPEEAAGAVKNAAGAVKESAGDAIAGAKDAMAAKSASADTSKVWDTIKPNLTPTETAAGVKDGSVVTRGVLKTVTQVPKAQDLEMIDAAKPYVLDAKSPDLAVQNMKEGIAESAQKVRQGLEDSPAIWNKNELKAQFGKIAEPITVKSDTTLHNTFVNFKRAVLQIADKADKRAVGVLDTRQGLDRLA